MLPARSANVTTAHATNAQSTTNPANNTSSAATERNGIITQLKCTLITKIGASASNAPSAMMLNAKPSRIKRTKLV